MAIKVYKSTGSLKHPWVSQWGSTFEGCRLILPILMVDSLINLLFFRGYLVLSLIEFRNFFKYKKIVRFFLCPECAFENMGTGFFSIEILQEVEVHEDQLKYWVFNLKRPRNFFYGYYYYLFFTVDDDKLPFSTVDG